MKGIADAWLRRLDREEASPRAWRYRLLDGVLIAVLLMAVFTIVDISSPSVAAGVALVCGMLALAAGRLVSRHAGRRRTGP
jgi:hypothetical protein